jgi:hypothetical protein
MTDTTALLSTTSAVQPGSHQQRMPPGEVHLEASTNLTKPPALHRTSERSKMTTVLTTLIGTAAAAAAIATAPLNAPENQMRSCQATGQSSTVCQSPGNVEVNNAPPSITFHPYGSPPPTAG